MFIWFWWCLFNVFGSGVEKLLYLFVYMGVWEGKLNKEIKMKVKKILGISDFIVDEL